jgi:tyrosyl-DNA phosphodiesterase 2
MSSSLPQPPDVQSLIGKILAAPLEDVPDTAVHQDYYFFDGSQWAIVHGHKESPSENSKTALKSFRLITWNIDVLSPGGEPRMAAALDHVEELISKSPPESEPVVIFFQEMSETDLKQIQGAKWVQERFYITDLDGGQWAKPSFGPLYGTTTLIDKTLAVNFKPFRVRLPSRFQRDGLFVDVRVRSDSERVLRLCNTHLESLVAKPAVRPLQVARAAAHMQVSKIYASVLGGDLNAIEPFDRTLHSDNGLKDAYLELGGEEDSDEGYTWGQQAPKKLRDQFGCSRMDKAFYWGEIKALSLERVGEGVEVKDEEAKKMIREAGGETFASDHLGLSILFEVVEPDH